MPYLMLFISQLLQCNKLIKSQEHITICYLFLACVSVGQLETLLSAGAKFRSVVTVSFWEPGWKGSGYLGNVLTVDHRSPNHTDIF